MPKFNINKRSQISTELTEKIRKVAYDLYEKRGRTSGHEQEDWLKAERLIKSGRC